MSEDDQDLQWDDGNQMNDNQMQQFYYDDNIDSFANEEIGFDENDDSRSYE